MLGKIFTSKNNKIKIFRVFRVFEYALGQEMRSWKRRKITGNFINQQKTHNKRNYLTIDKKQPKKVGTSVPALIQSLYW